MRGDMSEKIPSSEITPREMYFDRRSVLRGGILAASAAATAYAYRRFNGQLGMVWIDDRPDGNYGRYRPEHTTFDLNLNWRFTPAISVYLQGRNITDQPQKWYDTPPGYAEGTYPVLRQFQEYGANWVLGIKGSF